MSVSAVILRATLANGNARIDECLASKCCAPAIVRLSGLITNNAMREIRCFFADIFRDFKLL